MLRLRFPVAGLVAFVFLYSIHAGRVSAESPELWYPQEGFEPAEDTTCPLDYPYCGNSRVDEDEACDDGNDDDSDGCTRECQESCPGREYQDPPIAVNSEQVVREERAKIIKLDVSSADEIDILSRRRRKRTTSFCDDLCKSQNARRAESTGVTAVGLRPSLKSTDPDSVADMLKGLAFIKQMVCLLGKIGPKGVKQYAKLQEKLIGGIIGGMEKVEKDRFTAEGAAIWVRVSADCCQMEPCCLFWQRLNWAKTHKWVKCSPLKMDGKTPGFKLDNQARLAKGMGECLKAAMPKFSCTNTKTREVDLNM